MKNFNLIERLWTDSHEKQKVRGLQKYCILLLLLFTCVTHAYATSIPAGTVIYVDVSNFSATYNSGYYLCAVSSTNSSKSLTKDNTSGAATWTCNADTWYTLTQYSGNIYKATISAACSSGMIVVWSKNISGYNNLWEVNAAKSTAYDGTHNCLTISSGYSTHEARRTCCFNSTWTSYPSTFTVSYNGNGKTSGSVPTDANRYSSGATVTVKGNTGSLAKTGYTFSGWNTKANGTGTNRAVNSTFTITANTTLYAKWTAKSYTVNFDQQSGSGGSTSTSATYGSAMPSITLPTRDGYRFDGYYTSSGGSGTKYYNADGSSARSWNIASTTILYAKWVQVYRAYFVDVDNWHSSQNIAAYAWSGDGSSRNADWPGQVMTQVAGKTYDGKNIYYIDLAQQYDKIIFNNNNNGSQTSDITFSSTNSGKMCYDKSNWKAYTYDITFSYNGNGNTSGSVPSDGNTYHHYNETYPVQGKNTLVKTGYSFDGWNTASNGSGDPYAKDDEITPTGNVTLYAQWTAKNYNLTLKGNGGSDGSVTATYNSSTLTSLSHASYDGYSLNGYYTAKSGGSKIINSDGTIPSTTVANYLSSGKWVGDTVTMLWAQWTENMSTVSLVADPSGKGTFTIGGASVTSTTAGVTTTRSVTAVAADGYHWTGWSITGGATISSTSTNPTTVTGGGAGTAATLTATFAADALNYTITYGVGTSYTSYGTVSEGHSYASGSSQASGTEISLSASPATHYKLEGWYTTAACATPVAGAGTNNPYEFTLGANTSVYAKFILKQCTITLNKNGGSTGASSVTASHGSTLPSFTAHSRTGYTLNGYYTESSGGTKIINADGSLVASTSYADASKKWNNDATALTLYAQWTANTYTVSFNKQSGSGGDNSVTATFGAAMPSITAPTRTGYDFNGYYGSTGGSGTKYYNADGSSANAWDVANATTIYAYWTAHNYTITYSPSSAPTGCTYATKPTSCAYGNTATIVITPSTGYTVSVSARDASSNVVTLSNPSANTYTFTQPASNVTITVTATEQMTTITINTSPTGAGTLTVGASAFTPGNTTTAGVSTSRTVVATAGNDFTFGSWGVTGNATGTSSTNTYTLKGNGSAGTGTLTANFTLTPCSLWYSSNQLYKGSSGTKTPMSYDTSEEAYYIDVTTNSSPYYFRFYHNNSKEYSCDWSKHPAGKEVVANGSKVDVDKDVTDWGDHSACYFTGTSGSSIRIWFDYQNKKAWITEPGYSVTINNGDHGTVSPNGVRSVGASGLTITATPTEGYKLASWNVTGGAHVASSTAATTTLTATADGTVTAVWETESPIRLYYSNPAGWSPIYAYLWDVDNTSDHNADWPGTAITTQTELVDCQQFYYYEYYPSAHAGWDRIIFNGGDGTKQTGNITFSAASNAGQYNNAGKDATGSWQDPTNPWYFAYDGDSYNTTAHPLTCTSVTSGYVELDLAANTDYAFKFVENGSTWYGCTTATKITYENKATPQTMNNTSGGSANQTIKTAVAGTYRFTWDITNKRVTVTYPTSYKVQYSIGTVVGTAGSPSAAVSGGGAAVANNDYVASGTSVTFTAPAAKEGYTWAGWYDAATTAGNKLSVGDANTYTTTITGNTTVYAVYSENMFNVSASASPAAGGSVTPTSATSMGQVNGGNITASPNAGYSFTNWTISSGSGYFGASGTATTSTTANTKFRPTAAATLTGTFAEIMRTVAVNVNNAAFGSVSTTSLTSVGPATASAEVTATPVDGATFTRWDVVSGITIASGYTNTSNPVKINATAASKTLTAVFTETKHTVTLSTADGSKGTVGSNQSVGKITAVEITATPKSGYMFSKWVKTAGSGEVTYYTGPGNGQLTDASGEEKETTYICVTGNVTLQATWEADRSSGYVVHYGNSGKNADGGTDASQTRPWKDGKLYRATTEASDVSYFTFTAGVGDVDKTIYFKIWETSSNASDHWYGYNSYDGGKITGNVNEATLSTSYGDARLCITMPGNYVFTWNSNDKTLSVAYPTNVYYLRGGFNGWSWAHPMTETSSGVYSATVSMTEANHTYSGNNGFKLLIAGQYYGKDETTITRANGTGSASVTGCSTSGANMGLTTDYTGDYTFTYTVSTNTLQVTYPTAYKVTYGKGSVDGSASNCSAVDIDNSSAAVTSNSTWVKSGNRVVLTAPEAKEGYTYNGWFNNNSGTGEAITTAANCTITVSSALTRYACYAENLSAITITTDGHGTITTPSPNSSPYNLGVTTTQAINASANTGYSWSTWTTSGNAALGSSAATKSNTAKADGTNGGSGTITATFTPNHYDVVLDVNGATTGSDQTVTATFDAAMPTTQKGGSTPISAPSKTGYNFDGYTKNNNGTGTKYYTSALANNHVWDIATNNTHIYAKWDAKQSTLSFDYQTSATGYGTSGTVSAGSKATYDAEMPTLSGTLPTAANGYAFMGFYSATGGSGTKYYNADGTSANNWAEDTESTTTLYAYYQQAEITALAFDALNVDAGGTVGVTPTIDPTPVGDKIICWTILHDNDSPLDPQPEKTWDGTKLTFTAPAYSGTYKVQAVLRTGLSCGGGTELDTRTESFTVAGTHTVTVNYKCGDDVIKTATSETATPLDWSGDITAPDIFGYTFTRWDAADGVTIKNGESTPVTTSTDATIKIKATYNGKLTAVYTQKSMIYFKNTLGWSNVYVNFYESSYWNNPKGSGNQSVAKRNLAMTRYGETDIWYYDYGAASITPGLYVSFTSESQDNTQYFWKSGGVNVVYPANYADDIHTDKSSENGFKAATPMFVPLATQEKVTLNQSSGGKADYYNAGYWTKYTPGTGYRLEIYNNSTGAFIKAQDFTSADELMPMKAVLDLEGGTTYKFQLRRGGESSAGIYYGNTGTMTYSNHGQGTPWAMTNTMTGDFQMAKITTNTAGSYTFHLSYSPNASDEYRLRIAVDYPISTGDYRLLYSDAVQTKPLTSAIVTKENDGSDIVSFFVRPGSTPVLRIQQATVANDGKVTWKEYPTDGTPTNQITGTIATTITSGGKEVYNFNLSMDGEGALSVSSAEIYEGNFYIRTDAANSKWDNYKTDPDHLMTYSEYSIEHGGYTHYYCHWVKSSETGRKNVKFVIANDYSPNISDTLARETASGTWEHIADFMEAGGDLKRDANVRFMWDKRDNTISRAYVDGAQGDYSANFLYMLNDEGEGADKIRKSDESALTDHKVTFKDNGNWMYEANIQAQPDAKIKLLSNWGTSNTITQYFRGASDATETLIGGSGSNWYDIRLIYDFKTNRLIAGLIPSGTIDEQMAIHADVMFIREHQDDIAQLTFAEKGGKMGAITDIETAYGVLRFNKWTLNNKSKADGHSPLTGEDVLSRYERDLFYVSFPFRVAMEDVFGFGTYGQHWIIEYYDGASRAANGYWLESGPNWKFVTNRKGKYFEPGQGYIIALDLDELGESSSVWANTDQVELYFPSYGTMPNITSSTATYEIPEHKCTINRTVQADGVTPTGLPAEYDRRVRDSHWNVLGVPTYVNPDAPTYANTDWKTEFGGPNFLYQVSWTDNSVSPVSSSTFTYHAMHAYLVQYCGNVTWTASVSPSLAPRRNPEYRGNFEFRLEMLQNDKAVDRAFVKLSDDEHVTTGFEFNYDMSKEFNSKKANIYTLIGSEPVAGNVLPLTEQTTVVPVGVKIAANGDYTFSMPDGTEGTGITLIDNETGIRTPLGALDYTINLSAGTYDNRFVLEIAPIKQMPTDIELLNGETGENGVRKVMIDGILYIVKGGKMFDATGRRVE